MDPEKFINSNNRTVRMLLTIGVIAGASVAIVNLYMVMRNNLWAPKVTILNYNFEQAVANVVINGEPKTLIGDSTVWAGASFGIRFGTKNTSGEYTSIELIKNQMVYKVLLVKPATV